MLQSIFDIFWDGLLHPILQFNKLSRLNKEVNRCYYQTSRHVLFTRENLIANLMHGSMSLSRSRLRVKFNSEDWDLFNENVCYVASEFQKYLNKLHESSNIWQQTCAMFLHLPNNFFTFVASYRCGDSIGIEVGYQSFLPVWRALDHTRYLERHWRHLETLFGTLIFQDLEELRRNRTQRRY